MNDCLFEAQLPDLLSGSLSDADELQLNRHLEGCVHCRHALDRATLVPECLCAPPSRHRDDSHDRAPGIDPLLQALKDRTPELNDKRGVSLSRAGDIKIDSTAQSDGEPDSHLPEIPGYEVLSEISRGGMGVIYKARQLVPNRIVAVKMTKSGRFANREEIQRFQTEAAAAATLEHPHIVPIFEVGKSDGCHFYSMGFVDGCTLQDQLRGGPLAITAAAELGKTIAETVQFAHENGIVHRDLKPSNILIDLEGKPRIADFGLAKNTAVESGLTATGQILGTPSFMSPEQASGKLEDAGPLVDVYALGAILYAMLTGRPPFQAASVMETLSQVVDSEPVSPKTLNAEVGTDLETICLKCLDKHSERRYASARDVADELNRFLMNKPILARPASRLSLVRRWCKRNPLGTTIIAMVSLITIISPIVAYNQKRLAEEGRQANVSLTASLLAETEAKNLATENAARATRNLGRADEAVNDFLLEIGKDKGVLSLYPSTQLLRKKLLLKGKDYYEHLIDENPNAELTPRLANANYQLAQILLELTGEVEGAISANQRALELYNQLELEDANEIQYSETIANIHKQLGFLFTRTGETDQARTALETALRSFERLAASHPETRGYQRNLGATLDGLGRLRAHSGDTEQALKLFERYRQICNKLILDAPDEVVNRMYLANCLNQIAISLDADGQLEESLKTYQRALEVSEQLCREYPEEIEYQDDLSTILNNLAAHYSKHNDSARAIVLMERSLAIREQHVRENPSVFFYQKLLYTNHRSLGFLLSSNGKADKAITHYRKACEVLERLARDDPDTIQHQINLGDHLATCAELLDETGRPEDSLAEYRRSLKVREQVLEKHSEVASHQFDVATTQMRIAEHLSRARHPTEAMLASQAAEGVLVQLVLHNPDVALYREILAHVHNIQGYTFKSVGKRSEALAAFQQSVRVRKELAESHSTSAEEQNEMAKSLNNIGALLSERGEQPQAREAYRQSIPIRESLVSNHPHVSEYTTRLAGSYINLGSMLPRTQPKEAIELVNKAESILQNILEEEPGNVTAARFLTNGRVCRARALESLARYGEAVEDWRKVLDYFNPKRAMAFHVHLCMSLARCGRYVEAIALADEQLKLNSNDLIAYQFILRFADAIDAVNRDDSMTKEERSRLLNDYAAKAVTVLRQLHETGYFDSEEHRTQLRTDSDLAPLRNHSEFLKFTKSINIEIPVPDHKPNSLSNLEEHTTIDSP